MYMIFFLQLTANIFRKIIIHHHIIQVDINPKVDASKTKQNKHEGNRYMRPQWMERNEAIIATSNINHHFLPTVICAFMTSRSM